MGSIKGVLQSDMLVCFCTSINQLFCCHFVVMLYMFLMFLLNKVKISMCCLVQNTAEPTEYFLPLSSCVMFLLFLFSRQSYFAPLG